MSFSITPLKDLLVFEPRVFEDSRGFFFESYNENTFKAAGVNFHWVQDNQSSSSYGVIRGLHYQLNPHAQVKLVRVLIGEILDVVVDIRKASPTYGQNYAIELSAKNKKKLFIPEGFAHGHFGRIGLRNVSLHFRSRHVGHGHHRSLRTQRR